MYESQIGAHGSFDAANRWPVRVLAILSGYDSYMFHPLRGRHFSTVHRARLLCFESLNCALDSRASPFVAAVVFRVQPRTVRRAVKFARKGVEAASLLADLTLTTLAHLKVVEVMRAISVDILCQLVLINFNRLHMVPGKTIRFVV